MEKKTVRTRFAPSPTGFMHVGNLRTALYAYLFARHNNGVFILRIEDTDQEREVEGAVELIYRTLEKANMQIDEGPLSGGDYGPYVQSERKEIYAKYAKKLVELGGAYYCFCDKERLASLADENGVRKYDKHCLHLSKEEVEQKLKSGIPYVIRQNIPENITTEYEDIVYGKIVIDSSDLEDNILLKSDGMPTYNFANVIDDHLMGITHVIRGTEYLSSTPKYNLMYDTFGWDRPAYMHLPPIMKDATRKLSKRYGDANFEDFIAKGYLPEAIVNYIALLGWGPGGDEEKMTMDRMIEIFNVDNLTKSSSIFNEEKMRWLNSLYIRELPIEKFLELATPYFEKSAIAGRYDYAKFANILHTRVEILSDIYDKVLFIDDFKEYDVSLFNHKKMKTDPEYARTAIPMAISVLESLDEFNHDTIYNSMSNLAEDNGWKKGQLLSCLRVALTGLETTPGGSVEVADILGKEETIRRLNFSLNLLNKSSLANYKVYISKIINTAEFYESIKSDFKEQIGSFYESFPIDNEVSRTFVQNITEKTFHHVLNTPDENLNNTTFNIWVSNQTELRKQYSEKLNQYFDLIFKNRSNKNILNKSETLINLVCALDCLDAHMKKIKR